MKDIHQRIAEKLKRGQKVISKAAGRWGEVIGFDGHWVRIHLHNSRQVGVTSFLSGDPVRLVRSLAEDNHWTVVNPASAWKKLWKKKEAA